MKIKEVKGPSTEDLHFSPLEVKIPFEDQSRDRFEMHIKRFRAKVTKDRIMSDWKEHQSYEKPSERKRRKRRESAQRLRKMEFMSQRDQLTDKDDKKNNEKRKRRNSNTGTGMDERG